MSNARLLIAIEVFDFLRTLPRRDQQSLMKRFRELPSFRLILLIFRKMIRQAENSAYMCSESLQSSFGTIPPIGI